MTVAKHEWEPTDSQGYSMECLKCEKSIGIQDTENWNQSLDENCTSKN